VWIGVRETTLMRKMNRFGLSRVSKLDNFIRFSGIPMVGGAEQVTCALD
jgi:hypothetical protein